MADIPGQMTAVAIERPGGPEVLVPVTCDVPRPGPGQALVRVVHAGINRPDVLQRMGAYPPPANASPLPGLEIAGEIVAAGSGVPESALGARICALTNGGGYAEYCLAEWGACLPVPDGLPTAEAAALPETLFTVWHNVFQRGLARDGETILVHGGTSGIGSMAIKLGKLFGLTVIVTCGSDDKCDAARALGADHAINYRTSDFTHEVNAFTGGRGAELILDMVSGSYVQRNLDCLAIEGRLVTIATLGGREATIKVGPMMVKRQTLTGSTLRPRSDAFKALLARDIHENVWSAVAAGELRPAMDRIFPLREAAAAHARLESGDHVGKIVLEVAGEG